MKTRIQQLILTTTLLGTSSLASAHGAGDSFLQRLCILYLAACGAVQCARYTNRLHVQFASQQLVSLLVLLQQVLSPVLVLYLATMQPLQRLKESLICSLFKY